MQLSRHLLSFILVLYATVSVTAASTWSFDEATVSIHGKKAGVGGGVKEKSALRPMWSSITPADVHQL